jgi:hypothetical protein
MNWVRRGLSGTLPAGLLQSCYRFLLEVRKVTLPTMQIRCERCHAEYTLDESQVRGGVSDVQCAVCGHVFALAQPSSNQSAPGASAGSRETGDWFLQTADGKIHRVPGLTSLHTWIVDRRITRMDRVSPDGQAWQYAGELVDLVPFFDVVDEADRARTGAPPSQDRAVQVEPARRAPTPTTPRRSSPQVMAVSVPNDEVRPSHPRFPVVGMQAEEGGSHQHGALKLVVCLTVAAGVAYAGIRWQRGRFPSATTATKAFLGLPASLAGRRALARPPEARPEVGAGTAAAQIPSEGTTPSPSSRGPLVEALPSPPPAAAEKTSDKPSPAKPVVPASETYEKLVAEGDRALENGSNGKAKDLYQKALRRRPAGAKALSGLGFVALDRGQIPAAYQSFKRALAINGSLGPALFGMAEVHRARGEKALAVQTYQRYLQLSPKGSEATAARRQVNAIETGK